MARRARRTRKTVRRTSTAGRTAGTQKVRSAPNGGDGATTGKVTGMFGGETVTIFRTWSGHEFTDAETDALFAGEAVTVTATGRNGDYTATVRLGTVTGRDGTERVRIVRDDKSTGDSTSGTGGGFGRLPTVESRMNRQMRRHGLS